MNIGTVHLDAVSLVLRGRHCSCCARLAHDALTCLYLIVPLSSISPRFATPAAPPSILLLHASITPTKKQAKPDPIAYEIYFKLLANCIEYVLLLYTTCLSTTFDEMFSMRDIFRCFQNIFCNLRYSEVFHVEYVIYKSEN